jgi:hypothetical protein
MNNFSTVQAFLATALAFTSAATTTAHNISLIVTLFGLALSLFYISLGFRGVRVIQFWRVYLRLLESIPGVTSIDSYLFEFYRLAHKSGPEGNQADARRGPGHQSGPLLMGAPVGAPPVSVVSAGLFGNHVHRRGDPDDNDVLLGVGVLCAVPSTNGDETVRAGAGRRTAASIFDPSCRGTPDSRSDSRRVGASGPDRPGMGSWGEI